MRGTEVFISVLGSAALLLWGARMVRTGMTRAFGSALRLILTKYSRTRISAVAVGFLVTSILQSSTATALLVASFAARLLVPLPTALAIMLGADVGSAFVTQIFSLDFKWLWSLLIAIGVVTFIASASSRVKGFARITIGLGLMLLGLVHMSIAADSLRDSSVFRSLLSGLGGEPILGFLVAMLVTWLAHSSLSVVLLIMSLASSGALPLPLALALVLGANVGGAIAPFMALTGSSPAGRRVALGNLGIRTALAVPVLFAVAPAADLLTAAVGDPGRAVVHFHLFFNAALALSALPLVGAVASLTERLLPSNSKGPETTKPRHLDGSVIAEPSEALACAMRETLELGRRVEDMLQQALVVFETSDVKLLKDVERADNAVDTIHEAIKLYLIKIPKTGMTDAENRRYIEILTFTTNLEHVGDIIDKNLMELAAKKIRNQYTFSTEGFGEIRKLHVRVMDNIRLALNVFASRDVALAKRLLAEKVAMRRAELDAAESHYARLRAERPESIETSAIHLDVIRDIRRINSHLAAVAYPILESIEEQGDGALQVPAIRTTA